MENMLWRCITIRVWKHQNSVVALLQHLKEACQLVVSFSFNEQDGDAPSHRLLATYIYTLESLPGADLTGRAFQPSASLSSKILVAVAEYWQTPSSYPKAAHPDTVLHFSGRAGVSCVLLRRETERYGSYISHLKPVGEIIEKNTLPYFESSRSVEITYAGGDASIPSR